MEDIVILYQIVYVIVNMVLVYNVNKVIMR